MKTDITLTPEQVKLFNKLKAAYVACKKGGIYFANVYGSLEAYDKALVSDYQEQSSIDTKASNVFPADELRTCYSLNIPNEWCDDRHFIELTHKGMQVLKQKED